jgi:hypothetical protein
LEETPPIIPIIPPVHNERVYHNPRKMPRIWVGHDVTSDDIPQDLFMESTNTNTKNPPWYTARELFPRQTILEEDNSSLETDNFLIDSVKEASKLVTFAVTNSPQEILPEDEWPRIPEGDTGPWYGVQTDILSGSTTSNDYQYVQTHITNPPFVEYFKFDTKEATRDYVRACWNEGCHQSIQEGHSPWYGGDMPYATFNQHILGNIEIEHSKGFFS